MPGVRRSAIELARLGESEVLVAGIGWRMDVLPRLLILLFILDSDLLYLDPPDIDSRVNTLL